MTTTTSPTATGYNTQRRLDRMSDGTLVAGFVSGAGTSQTLYFQYSKDDGQTFLYTNAGTGDPIGGVDNASIFVDVDDYLHVAWKQNGTSGGRLDGGIYYVRGTPNAGKTLWTWGTIFALNVAADTNLPGYTYPDLIAHREGTGWVVHIVASYSAANPVNYPIYYRINISSGGAATGVAPPAGGPPGDFSSTAGNDWWYLSNGGAVNIPTFPTIDFNHTGDGKTIAGGTPHLYIGWTAGKTGAGFGVRFIKGVYAAGVWSWNAEREIDNANYTANTDYGMQCIFDGTRVMFVGQVTNATTRPIIAHERDAADTTTITRNLFADAALTTQAAFGSSSTYDRYGNIYIFGRGNVTGAGSLIHHFWNRSTQTITTTTTDSNISGTANSTVFPSAKRGYRNNAIEWIYTAGNNSPYVVKFDRISLFTTQGIGSSPSVYGAGTYGGSARVITDASLYFDTYGGFVDNYHLSKTGSYPGGYLGGYGGQGVTVPPAWPGGWEGGWGGVGASRAPLTFSLAADLSAAGTYSMTGFVVFAQASLTGAASISLNVTFPMAAILSAGATLTATSTLMQTLSADLTASSRINLFLPFPTVADPSTGRPPYRLVIVDVAGNKYAELENARINSVSWLLNEMGAVDFDLPATDAKIAECIIPQREVQVWRGNQIIWWGVLVKARGDDKTVSFQAVTLDWYFTRRYVGRVPKNILIKNGTFEENESNWTFTYTPGGTLPQTAPVHSISTTTVYSGKRSLKLTGSANGSKRYARQRFNYTNPVNSGKKVTLTIVGNVYIETFTGPAANNWGLYIEKYDPTIPNSNAVLAAAGYTKSYGWAAVPITATTRRNVWNRMEASIEIPNDGVAYIIDTRLFSINGVVYWDEVTVTASEQLGYFDVDEAKIVEGLVLHSQDVAMGKSSLNILTDCPNTGVKRTREYSFIDRQQVWDAMAEFPAMANGVDLNVEITPTTRTLKTYFPRKGVDSDQVLALGSNILSFSVDVDADQTTNQIIVQKMDSEGSDREEGIASDPSILNGLVLEKVYNGTPGSSVSSLQSQADRGLARYRRPVTIPSITTQQNSGDLLARVYVGDRVPVRISKGWVQANGPYRITGITLDPNSDTLTFTITPEDQGLSVILDYGATGWKYLQQAQAPTKTSATNVVPVETDIGNAAYAFDDSTWATGQAAIGWAYPGSTFNGYTTRNTAITAQNELWMRKHVKVTSDMKVYVKCDNFGYLYVNGNLITGSYIEARDASDAYVERGPFVIPQAYLNATGDQVVALHVQDKLAGYGNGDIFVGDVRVVGVYDKYAAVLAGGP